MAGSVLLGLGGCQIASIAGVIAKTMHETGSTMHYAQYQGLEGKSFAVIFTAPRSIIAGHPSLMTRMTNSVTGRIVAQNELIAASGVVPGSSVRAFQESNPSWAAWPFGRVAEELGVERLIVVDIVEYRHVSSGNRYVWDGQFTVRVGVIAADSGYPDEFAWSKDLSVRYPDGKGYTESDMREQVVAANLQDRMANRISWLFYDHEEPNALEY